MVAFGCIRVNDTSGSIFHDCGAMATPRDLVADGQLMTLTFHTDESGASVGFRATYTGLCGGDVTGNTSLVTPNYPGDPPDVTCEWSLGQTNVLHTLALEGHDKDRLPACGSSPFKVICFVLIQNESIIISL
ncbi:CUB domain-containing protein 2-like [Physella acuta]|uniref:CUB domain-containing protein 2-like n=1 Tax=Physella acuta TaxID=109671 RepID=UPI0027DB3076|nr:CUB domain-containing protein 2-like [Physella acuta]